MKWVLGIMIAFLALSNATAQAPSPAERSFFNRMLHPFGSAKKKTPKYQDSRLRGLLVEVQVPAEPIRLSEVRQLRVQARLSNLGAFPVSLDFPTSQRIDIQLLNPAGEVLTDGLRTALSTRKLAISRSIHAKTLFTTKRSRPANCSPGGFTVSKFSSPNIRNYAHARSS